MKKEFLKYIGGKDSLAGYSRSYKLVLYKAFFSLMDDRGSVAGYRIAEFFRDFYVDRVQRGLKADEQVDTRIENITQSSIQDVYNVILMNPFKYINQKGYLLRKKGTNQKEDSKKERMMLNPKLLRELTQDDINDILSIVEHKLNLYYSRIDKETTSTSLNNLDNINQKIHDMNLNALDCPNKETNDARLSSLECIKKEINGVSLSNIDCINKEINDMSMNKESRDTSLNNLEYIKRVIDRCDILLEGHVISKEYLLQEYAKFLGHVMGNEGHNVGVSLDTGSICFDAISLIFAAVSNWTYNTKTPDKVIASLEVDDIVIYDQKRRIYKGKTEIEGKTYIKLETHRKEHRMKLANTTFVMKKDWSKIIPYYGDSVNMDGRGLRKNKNRRSEFLATVFNVPQEQIPGITDVSTVVVMPRERANYLINNLTIKYGPSDFISLLEIVTISYFTENDEYQYSGNSGKTEPILKITGKVSVARRLIVRAEENKIIGLWILGEEFLVSGRTELPSLLKRESLGYVVVATHIDSESIGQVFEEVNNPIVFACTRRYLCHHGFSITVMSPFAKELAEQVKCIIDQMIRPIKIKSDCTWAEYSRAKRNLGMLRNSPVLGADKEYFIIQAHTLMKLYITSVFPIAYMEELIKDNVIDVDSPQYRMERLVDIAQNFPENFRDRANSIIELIVKLHGEIDNYSEKEAIIRQIIRSWKYKRIAIVIPKAFYRDILLSRSWMETARKMLDITIVTANKFNNKKLYDCIIVTGIFEGRKFNVFRSKAAPVVIPIICDFEHDLYRYKEKIIAQTEQKYNNMLFFSLSHIPEQSDVVVSSDVAEISAISEEEQQLDAYIKKINEIALVDSIEKYHHSSYGTMADISAIVRFDNKQIAFFSKTYKPYVFDNTSQSVVETELKDLLPGDRIVFTQNNDETKDIVDAVLSELINSDKLGVKTKAAYRKSKRWKYVLATYIRHNRVSIQDVSGMFSKAGTPKGIGAIRDWLDPDSYTVGPFETESYRIVAMITNDSEMAADPHGYCEACSLVRKIRRQILKQIGLAIISNFSGVKENDDPLFNVVAEKIDSLAQILRIKSVIEVKDKTLSSAMINKPLNMQEE